MSFGHISSHIMFLLKISIENEVEGVKMIVEILDFSIEIKSHCRWNSAHDYGTL